jgi:hypothetical protein
VGADEAGAAGDEDAFHEKEREAEDRGDWKLTSTPWIFATVEEKGLTPKGEIR